MQEKSDFSFELLDLSDLARGESTFPYDAGCGAFTGHCWAETGTCGCTFMGGTCGSGYKC